MPVITDSKTLKKLISALKGAEFIAIDTEFDRRNTYYAKFCLAQIAGPSSAFAVDPLAPGLSLKPFVNLLKSRKILKVFHSAREDIEVLYNSLGVIPKPVFDTQIAASLLGYGQAISYAGLLETLTGEALDKSQRYSDWKRRPLRPEQIEYAMADAVHLRDIYAILRRDLEARGLEKAASEEMQKLLDKKRYRGNPKTAWEKIGARGLGAAEIKLLKRLAAWREKKAQTTDIPRQWVIKDALIRKIIRRGKGFGAALANDKELQSLFEENKINDRFLDEIIALTKG